jgi:hypothetical protein
MRVVVVQHYGAGLEPRIFEGSARDLIETLIQAYPWVVSQVRGDTDLEDLVKILDSSQAYTAVIQDSDINLIKAETYSGDSVVAQILGQHVKFEEALRAAAFLAGKKPTPEEIRAALVENELDPEVAALLACGLEATSDEIEALRAILGASLKKAEAAIQEEQPVGVKKVEAVVEDGIPFAKSVERAAKDGAIFPIKLGAGKHVSGTLLAWDKKYDKRYLLKSGSGKQNPAAGMNECSASQNQREAAFYAIASSWGLAKYVPECHLLTLDGKDFAAMTMLPMGFKNLNTLRSEDKTLPKRLFMLFQLEGTVQKWAALDYVLGNVDRHSGNIMVQGDKVFLIDHGSTFAGNSFSPAINKSTFTPAYLRSLCPDDFKKMTAEEKLKYLPRVSEIEAKKLGEWILSLDDKILAEICYRYAIDPEPEIDRLNNLKAICLRMPADLAVNTVWVCLPGNCNG